MNYMYMEDNKRIKQYLIKIKVNIQTKVKNNQFVLENCYQSYQVVYLNYYRYYCLNYYFHSNYKNVDCYFIVYLYFILI